MTQPVEPLAVTLRSVPRLGDREALRDLLESSELFHAYELDVALELLDDVMAKGRSSDYRFLFADVDDRLAGYVCFGPITVTDRRYDLYWIGVHKNLHGRGIGRRLLEAAEDGIRRQGGQRIFVETSSREDYAPTRRFYAAQGYVEVARVPGYYADDDDRVIFAKGL